jgi:phosphatidylserine/phosphatidylglycerophosphate/cardiolipin synthase-like enzyme
MRRIKKQIKDYSKYIIIFFIILFFFIFLTGIYNIKKCLPAGMYYESNEITIPTQDLDLLIDLTYIDKKGTKIIKQEIFDQILDNIKLAKDYIVIDMFLFNDDSKILNQNQRNISKEIITALIEKKKQETDIQIYIITDPINTAYSDIRNIQLEKLQEYNIDVIYTDLNKLRDSNPLYSSIQRTILKWFSPLFPFKIFPHPFRINEKTNIKTYINLLNFKANHRKVFTANTLNGPVSIIASANAHDASSKHSNIGILIKGKFTEEILNTELKIAEFSGTKINIDTNFNDYNISNNSTSKIKLITEKKIQETLITELKKTIKGDKINIAMFYLSNKKIITELLACADRGVDIRIILDPNKDAFGHEKNGIPNRQVASKLVKDSNNKIKIRWYNTNGEQFHTKIIIIEKANETIIILGSANLTRRNLENYNLELDVYVKTPNNSSFAIETYNYFDIIWTNKDNNTYTVDYTTYEDNSKFKYCLYKLSEFTGLCTY